MIVIIDHGFANIANIKNAFDYLAVAVKVSKDPDDLKMADKIVLPGVGAFSPAMNRIQTLGLVPIIKEKAVTGVPILGVCLGMQMLFTKSEENGSHEGLNLIPGSVVKIETKEKIPHMGWNSLVLKKNVDITKTIETGEFVYFVHSYHCVPEDQKAIVATTDYGSEITAIVARENVYGMQFHPEKSQDVGLRLLKQFGDL